MDEKEYAFLNEPAPEEPAQPEPVAEAPPVAEVPAPVPEVAAPTAAQPREEQHVPLAALKAEREKRQQYERELAELRQKAQQPEPSFYEAPEQYVAQVEQRAMQRVHMALEAELREQHADYDEIVAEVTEAAQGNPLLVQQVFSSPNPARAAYKLGQQLRELKAMKDPGAYRAQIEAEVRASIKAEQEAAEAAKAKAAAAIPPDLASARSAVSVEQPEELTLDSILASRKRR